MIITNMFRNSFIYMMVVVNTLMASIAYAVETHGIISMVFAVDFTMISTGMALTFALFMALVGINAYRLNAITNTLTYFPNSLSILGWENATPASLQARAGMANEIMTYLPMAFLILGILATMAGLYFALSGVDPVVVEDATKIGPMVLTMLSGLGVKFCVSMFGAGLYLWAKLNNSLLKRQMLRIIALALEAKERAR